MGAKPLAADKLRFRTDPALLPFESTADLADIAVPAGQERAIRALRFGAQMHEPGYNIYVSGAKGSGKHRAVQAALERIAASRKPAADWCYVYNFTDARQPTALRFKAGEGALFKQAMADFTAALRTAMARLFASDSYLGRHTLIVRRYARKTDAVLDTVREAAEARGLSLLERPEGRYAFHPLHDTAEPADRAQINRARRELRGVLQEALQAVSELARKRDEALKALDREMGEAQLKALLQPLYQRFGGHEGVRSYLNGLTRDVALNLSRLQAVARGVRDGVLPFHRYEVNLLIDNREAQSAPVIAVGLPALSRLVGRVERVPLVGSTITDFMFVHPGALHKANGGFLLIEALDLMQQEAAWDALKRAIRDRRITIESLNDIRERNDLMTIRPEAIPLDVKVVLIGEPWVFDRLRSLDPDFAGLFKVQAEFANTAARDDTNCMALLRMIATVCRRGRLRHLDRSAAARLIDEAARIAGDGERISVRIGRLYDLVREANGIAGEAGRNLIAARDIERALAAKDDRTGRMKALEQDLIRRRLVFIETEGQRVGQVNALTVMNLRGAAFGVPARITASVGPGLAKGITIERIAHYVGQSRRRGAQTLAAYLNRTYSPLAPLSLLASVAFEQVYGPIDGDSASAAELVTILSAIADVPLQQGIAITGAIDQHGILQPVGNINQKIEGFFDICRMRGWSGRNGVIIPAPNCVNLMLRDDVIDAAKRAHFSIYTAASIDDVIEILSGREAGQRKPRRSFPRGSFHRLVADGLLDFARPRVLRPVPIDRWWGL